MHMISKYLEYSSQLLKIITMMLYNGLTAENQVINITVIKSCRICIFGWSVPLRHTWTMQVHRRSSICPTSHCSFDLFPFQIQNVHNGIFYFIHRIWVWTHCSIPTCPPSLRPLQFCAIVKPQLFLFMSRHLSVLPQRLAVHHNWPSCRESTIECECLFTRLFS